MAAGRSAETAKNATTMELEGDRTIVISRTFNGPARLVYDAWTKLEFVKRWFAPKSRGVEMVSVEAEVRVGGTYRYVSRPAGHPEFTFAGEYLELVPHSKLVYTQRLEPYPDGAVVTITLEERSGRTHLVAREVYPSAEVREMVLASGMEGGMRETMDQLDELVASPS